MKWILSFATLLVFSGFGQQDTSRIIWIKDLDFVYQNLKQTSSYKTQPASHRAIENKYQVLKSQFLSMDMSTLDCYLKLLELTDEVLDFHNEISGNTTSFSYADLADEPFLRNIKYAPEYNFYPKQI